MKLDRLVDQLERDVEAIVNGLAAALGHLEEWTGEYPGSASGAPPASAGGAGREPDKDGEPGTVLTRFELLAISGDPAGRHRLALLGHLRASAVLARSTFAELDGRDSLAGELTCDSEDLAVLRWAARRLREDAVHVGAAKVDRLGRAVMTARGLVDLWQPPASKPPAGCRLHSRVGDHVEVARHHAGAGLCRRCGTFRKVYGADPTPAVLRAWSKGQKPTAGQIAEAITAGKKKRKRKRRR